jgi:hypothetical protein
MDRPSLSPYQYLTFLLPGALVLFVFVFGWNGWPYGEPGAGAILGLSAAAFMIGHALAAIANYFQASWWGHLPGSRLQSSEGLFDEGGRYAVTQQAVTTAFEEAFPSVKTFEAQFGVAYAEAQAGPLGPKLQAIVEQIGYYRSMATASALSLVVVVVFYSLGHRHLPLLLWTPLFLLLTLLNAYRFRRFWRYVGEYVVADVLRRRDRPDSG